MIVRENLQVRQEAVVQAKRMIADETEHFLKWLDGRTVVPTIEALSGASRRHSNGRARSRPPHAGVRRVARGRRVRLARGLTSKLLHPPLSALNAANEAERAQLIAALSRVYRLPEAADEMS